MRWAPNGLACIQQFAAGLFHRRDDPHLGAKHPAPAALPSPTPDNVVGEIAFEQVFVSPWFVASVGAQKRVGARQLWKKTGGR